MSHHSSDYESAAADLSEYFGQPIFYRDPSIPDQIEIEEASVFPERTERRQRADRSGWDKVQVRDIKFDGTRIGGVIKMNATITIDDVPYSIDETGIAIDGRLTAKVKRVTVGEVTRPKMRG